MEGLSDPRPGTPRQISDAQVEETVPQTLQGLPRAAIHWCTWSPGRESWAEPEFDRPRSFKFYTRRNPVLKENTEPKFDLTRIERAHSIRTEIVVLNHPGLNAPFPLHGRQVRERRSQAPIDVRPELGIVQHV